MYRKITNIGDCPFSCGEMIYCLRLTCIGLCSVTWKVKNAIKKVKIALVFGPGPPSETTPAPSPPPVCSVVATDQYDTAPNLNFVATMSDEQQEEV